MGEDDFLEAAYEDRFSFDDQDNDELLDEEMDEDDDDEVELPQPYVRQVAIADAARTLPPEMKPRPNLYRPARPGVK